MRIIDLSMPIAGGHPRWATEITATGDLAKGDLAQVDTAEFTQNFTVIP